MTRGNEKGASLVGVRAKKKKAITCLWFKSAGKADSIQTSF